MQWNLWSVTSALMDVWMSAASWTPQEQTIQRRMEWKSWGEVSLRRFRQENPEWWQKCLLKKRRDLYFRTLRWQLPILVHSWRVERSICKGFFSCSNFFFQKRELIFISRNNSLWKLSKNQLDKSCFEAMPSLQKKVCVVVVRFVKDKNRKTSLLLFESKPLI